VVGDHRNETGGASEQGSASGGKPQMQAAFICPIAPTSTGRKPMMMSVTMHPIWQSGAVILGLGVAASMLLQLLVHRLLPEAVRRDHTELGAAIFAVIGTTYAVLLAFMAMTAWERYSAAESLTRQEANLAARIIGVAESLPGPADGAIRAGTLAYLTHIVGVEWPDQIAGRTLPATDAALPGLRRSVTGFVPAGEAQARLQDVLIGAVGDLESARRDRRLAAEGTVPHLVWAVLLSGGALLVGFSFLLGAPGSALHLVMTAALVASGLLVVLLIVGLSSPFHGALTIAPDAYRAVLDEAVAGAPATR
jgi:hypothetical protein